MAGEAGLCGGCAWADAVRSDLDARYAKYPSLPRLECAGFELAKDEG